MRFWDSSALVALLVEEPDSSLRAARLTEDPVLAVWWGARVECESAIQRRMRDSSLTDQGARLARQRLRELVDSWREVAPSPVVRTLAIRLLRTHPLRCADALQLAAALTLISAGAGSMGFVCADRRLNDAADIEGLNVLE
ncbi:MAG: type II toxin-antitoxin system VapC family toxin [Verrucomicrobia bacterium]|nr:type II toxin-antitoxin system VapC family toxin [Verrucomicrobiota bacterium]